MLSGGLHFCADSLLPFLASQKQVDWKRLRGISGHGKGKDDGRWDSSEGGLSFNRNTTDYFFLMLVARIWKTPES